MVKVGRGRQDGHSIGKILLGCKDERQPQAEGDDEYADLDIEVSFDQLEDGHVDPGEAENIPNQLHGE
jgi:hypothetical protein